MSITWLILICTLVIATILVLRHRSRAAPTMESFFVANRRISWGKGTLTLSANWFQAPATLLSGNLAFAGMGNFAMFWIPNVIAMLLPGFLVDKIRARVPKGYTIPQFMGHAHGEGVRFMFNVSAFGALIGAMAYTLSGLTQWLEPLGVNPLYLALFITICAYLWAVPEGIVGAIKGDMIKIAALLIIVIGAIVITLSFWSDAATSGRDLRLTPSATSVGQVFWTFGIAMAISLIGGPICNPDLGERTYVGVRRSNYIAAATIFGLGVLATGSLGFLAWRLGVVPSSGELVTYALLKSLMPASILFGVSVILVVILTAAFASMFASAADLIAIEFIRRATPDTSDMSMVWWSRALMLVPIILAGYLATRDKNVLDLNLILQSLAVIRGEAIVPILVAVFFPQILGRVIFWGMLLAFIGGISFTFGDPIWRSLTGGSVEFLAAHGKPIGALWALLVPACAALISLVALKGARVPQT